MKSKSGVPERLKTHYSGDKKVIANTLIPSNKITHPPPPPPPRLLLIKLGLMKQFVKVLEKEGNFFEYFYNTFLCISKKLFFDRPGCAFH